VFVGTALWKIQAVSTEDNISNTASNKNSYQWIELLFLILKYVDMERANLPCLDQRLCCEHSITSDIEREELFDAVNPAPVLNDSTLEIITKGKIRLIENHTYFNHRFDRLVFVQFK
jgi:hypothetical protein